MSDSDEIVVNARRTGRLNLDSQEQARAEAEELKRQEQIQAKKEQKRRKREQQARLAEQQEIRKKELQRHFNDPNTMIEPDSDSKDHFERAQKKIQRAYPDIKMPKEMHPKKRKIMSQSDSQDQDSQDSDSQDSESESQSEQQSEVVPKKKKIKKEIKRSEKKERKREERAEENRVRHKAKQVKIEEKNPKEALVNQVAVRWWYCLPEWPPANFDYQSALNKQGYRLVNQDQFRVQQNLLNGLLKAAPIDGFIGIYKTKQKIIDVRPKDICPSLNFLRSKTTQELTSLLREALRGQIQAINSQSFKTEQDAEVEKKLARRLSQIS